jgi:hypothetical protein
MKNSPLTITYIRSRKEIPTENQVDVVVEKVSRHWEGNHEPFARLRISEEVSEKGVTFRVEHVHRIDKAKAAALMESLKTLEEAVEDYRPDPRSRPVEAEFRTDVDPVSLVYRCEFVNRGAGPEHRIFVESRHEGRLIAAELADFVVLEEFCNAVTAAAG